MSSNISTAFIAAISIFLLSLYLYINLFPIISPIIVLSPPQQHPTSHHVSITCNVSVSILFPDWQILVVAKKCNLGNLTCVFPKNYSTSARVVGTLGFICTIPVKLRRKPLPHPILSSSLENVSRAGVISSAEMFRWNNLAYESITTENDVVLFVKGINKRHGVNRPASDFECLFDGVRTEVITAVQEIFRCRKPNITETKTKVSLRIKVVKQNGTVGVVTVPSAAYYDPERTLAIYEQTRNQFIRKSLICACTMVYNVAKFLKEWVMYHASIGVEKFILYNNDSDDELEKVVNELVSDGFDINVVFWIWPKTQEAGFSHCSVLYNNTCTWMMFVDVDEFVYSTKWAGKVVFSKHMLGDMVTIGSDIGQVMIGCYEFGPSGRNEHPREGVTQGYNCRRKEANRHKSIVLLNALDESLLNVIHHFRLKPTYRSIKMPIENGIVNHYKYQAWSEFKTKYRRRVSAYVVDWTRAVNLASKDRAPGLGVLPVEPNGWAQKFCEVYDNNLRDLARVWFGHQNLLDYYMAWQR